LSRFPIRASLTCLVVLAATATVGGLAGSAQAAAKGDRAAVYALAGGCFRVAPSSGGALGLDGAGYRAGATPATTFSFKATGLGTFLVMDGGGQLVGEPGGKAVVRNGGPETAGPADEWAPTRVAPNTFTLRSTASGKRLATGSGGALALATTGAKLRLTKAGTCRRVPEAGVDATGKAPKPTNADGTIDGFADTHLHITADMRAGGSVIAGKPFDRFGVARALGRDADAADHGTDGSLDYTGNLLRDGVPFGTHDTAGWPTFTGWPTHDTNTHEQVYYAWLERAWRAGMRLTVAETVEDTQLCKVEPKRRYSCDETTAIKGQIKRLRQLQDYVDAQSGGPGRGWFRIVTSPAQARRVMARGKLAVVIGIESSFPLDCKAQPGAKPCTTKQVDTRLDALRKLGVRSLFIAHWADNGFAGAAIEGGVKGKFINALGRVETGRYFQVGTCPDPSQGEELQSLAPIEIKVLSQFFPATKTLADDPAPPYPAGRHCNVRGLTSLGRHLVRRMMATHMLIEMDHMSERARESVLKLAEQAHYPVVSGHSDTGGLWTQGELKRLTAIGGIASQRLDDPAALAKDIVARTSYRSGKHYFGVGLGTDTGGFSSLPGAPATKLAYPFHLDGSHVSFSRETTGSRTFDLNTDGVAHYGLLPDLLADMQRQPEGKQAMKLMFRSAESYLQMWSLATRR
jgi:microsomal dipeptidase-like Zn-dependent dipeptidase